MSDNLMYLPYTKCLQKILNYAGPVLVSIETVREISFSTTISLVFGVFGSIGALVVLRNQNKAMVDDETANPNFCRWPFSAGVPRYLFSLFSPFCCVFRL